MGICVIAGCLAGAGGAELFAAGPGERASVRSVVKTEPNGRRLVRRLAVVPPEGGTRRDALAELGLSPEQIRELSRNLAIQYGMDPLLVQAVIEVESNYDPFAVSPKGAQGLMQLMPGTARDLSVRNSFNPLENIEAGVRHLKHLLERFGGNIENAVAAYNAGAGAVERHGGVPPYRETADYVAKVSRKLQEARRAADSQIAAPAESEYPPLISFVDESGRLHVRTLSKP
jgi:soluble lytic murein transglycosylase-like protein